MLALKELAVNKKGLTLIELLATLLIFSLGIIPMLVLFNTGYKQTAQAKHLMIAQSIGRTMISEIKSLGFAVLSEEISSSALGLVQEKKPVEGRLVTSDENSILYPEYYGRFLYTLRLEKATAINNNKIRVELEIEWQEPDRRFSMPFGTVVVGYDT